MRGMLEDMNMVFGTQYTAITSASISVSLFLQSLTSLASPLAPLVLKTKSKICVLDI